MAVYPGTREGTILVSTHMDTAGTDRGIVPIIGDDGVIRTDGSTILGADDKSGLAGCLELLTLLNENPGTSHPTIEFVVSVGEESGLVGSRQMDVSRLNATHGFVLDTAGVMGSITYWSPTSVYLTVTFHGRKAHAGVEPEKGVSAIQVAADAIAAMTLGRIDEETVANIGSITGGEARNIIPDTAVLLGMARSHDQAKLDAQLAAMRRACDDAAAARGATVDFEAEEIYRTYKIADGRPALPRGRGRDPLARSRGRATQVRRRHRRQLLQRQGHPVRRTVDRHGRRARHHGAHRHRRPRAGGEDPRRDSHASAAGRGADVMTHLTRHLGAAFVAVALLAGCGTAPAPQGACARYAELNATVEQLRASPVPSGDVEQLRTAADQLRLKLDAAADALDRIQMLTDGRLDQAIGVARQQLDEIRASLVVAKYAAAETLGPQITQAADDLAAALAPVQNLLDSQCATG